VDRTGTFTTADGTELFTRTWEHPDPIGTVLIVHGMGEHSGRWHHVAEHFVNEGFEVFSYDQRAHGRSGDGVLDIGSFDDFVSDLAEMIERVRTDGRPLVVYAHSMGGLIGTMHAESSNPQPDLFVLSAPALAANTPAPVRLAAKVLGRIVPTLTIKSTVEKDHLSRDPKVGEAYVADPLVYMKGTTRFGKEFLAAMDAATGSLQDISTNTLVIHGADDELVPPRASAPLAGVEGVERRVFPGLRHEMHNEPESKEVLDFVTGWVKSRLQDTAE